MPSRVGAASAGNNVLLIPHMGVGIRRMHVACGLTSFEQMWTLSKRCPVDPHLALPGVVCQDKDALPQVVLAHCYARWE